METNPNIDRIEKYLSNDMSSEEKQAFDQQVVTDTGLADEFIKRRAAHEAIDFLVAKNLKKQLEEMENEEGKNNVISLHKRRRSRIVLLSLAASVLLVIGFFSIYLQDTGSTGPQLAAANYEIPSYSVNRSKTVDFEDLLSKGVNALKEKEYQTAITTLDSVAQSDEYFVIAQFYLAHAYYQSTQYEQAEEKFEIVSASNDIRYRDDADWYGLLACLAKEGNCQDKITSLAENANHSYQQQAISIQNDLKE